jgi:hypothetical protein
MRWNMSLKGWLLSLGVALVVYMVLLFGKLVKANAAQGPLVFIVPLTRPVFWLIALPAFGLVFGLTFKHSSGAR